MPEAYFLNNSEQYIKKIKLLFKVDMFKSTSKIYQR